MSDNTAEKKRICHGRCRVCVSAAVGEDSPWFTSEAMQKFGFKIDDIPLKRLKDLHKLAPKLGEAEAHNDAERDTRRGDEAYADILPKLFPADCDNTSTVVIADLLPNHGDVMMATVNLALQFQGELPPATGKSLPNIGYFGAVRNEDPEQPNEDYLGLCSMLQEKLTSDVAEPSAGPVEPTASPDDCIARPSLSLLAWGQSSGCPFIPSEVENRFKDTVMEPDWKVKCRDARAEIKRVSEGCIVGGANNPFSLPVLLGPDLSQGSVPKSLETELDLNKTPAAEFDVSDSFRA